MNACSSCPHRDIATLEIVAIAAEKHSETHNALICYLHTDPSKQLKLLISAGQQTGDLTVRLADIEARRAIGL